MTYISPGTFLVRTVQRISFDAHGVQLASMIRHPLEEKVHVEQNDIAIVIRQIALKRDEAVEWAERSGSDYARQIATHLDCALKALSKQNDWYQTLRQRRIPATVPVMRTVLDSIVVNAPHRTATN